MQLVDVNVLIYAFREDSRDHVRYRTWLEELAMSGHSFAVPELVLASFLRLVTNGQIFRPGTPLRAALAFVETLRRETSFVPLTPGKRHWEIFVALCESSGATGNLVANAYLAAMAVEHGGEWITADKDFARFPGVRWRHPLS